MACNSNSNSNALVWIAEMHLFKRDNLHQRHWIQSAYVKRSIEFVTWKKIDFYMDVFIWMFFSLSLFFCSNNCCTTVRVWTSKRYFFIKKTNEDKYEPKWLNIENQRWTRCSASDLIWFNSSRVVSFLNAHIFGDKRNNCWKNV